VLRRPFEDQCERPPGQRSPNDFERVDTDQCLEIAVPSVKMAGLWSRQYMLITIPKNALIVGTPAP
jgi:hypothetical protein